MGIQIGLDLSPRSPCWSNPGPRRPELAGVPLQTDPLVGVDWPSHFLFPGSIYSTRRGSS
ncbi:hypothetical protein I7I50_08024 [Histoplasma capsulatum G186AR]|uniref:Uncharacterized protein n=1 Tax=Ajellomyces capsulatus TaxID=5037 RepID=A0A8H7YKS8_AJECA|nr:hypothetical protein I7I52_08540 [Histoplasma capsulatum]QSS68571.1 hypothetical protein I7I50_08024 [Histoplasma capsulatum G186AR]